MLVNISGAKKVIPGIGKLPPVSNYDATETEIRRLICFKDWKVYEASTGRLITKTNVDNVMYGSSGSGTGGSGSGGGTAVGGVNWKVLG